ncbi:MAG: hypothetical protein ABIR34_03270 [Marmoricola sp.]
MAPATAAAPVARSGANAITVAVAGNQNGSGDTTATNDGTTETKTGDATPPASVLQGGPVNAGALAQEATAKSNGESAACAGVAGNGGSVAQLGDSSCLDPGEAVNASLGSLDLSGLVVADPASALAPINAITQPVIDAAAPLITQVIEATGGQFDDLGLTAGFGLVEGRCTASPGTADGSATLTDAAITLSVPGKTLTLLDLPLHPKANTHYATDLSDVLDLIADGVETDLNNSFDGQAAPAKALLAPFREQIIANVRSQVEENLAPLEQNLLDITLNRQIRTDGAIKVRALDLEVLPVLQDQLDASLASLQIGNAACGPSGRSAAPAAVAPPAKASGLPRAVSAGYGSMPAEYSSPESGDSSTSTIALAAFAVLVSLGAGLATIRRRHD